jgi:hypothetical protein
MVAFYSRATNLAEGDNNPVCDEDNDGYFDDNCPDFYVHNLCDGSTQMASANVSSVAGNGDSSGWPSLSGDGRYVAFPSRASDLVVDDTNNTGDVFLRSLESATSGDADLDGLDACNDNCPSIYNPEQANFDGDTWGNECDPDDDNDLLVDQVESHTGVLIGLSDTGTDPLDQDTDSDGCADGEELTASHLIGGQRDPNIGWDFYDVNANKVIDLQDAIVVLQHFGHGYNGGAYVDGTDNLLDRTAPVPAMPWLAQEANNGLDLGDALAVLKSFGDNCVAAP